MGVTVYIDDSKLFEKIVITFLMLSSNIFWVLRWNFVVIMIGRLSFAIDIKIP